MVERLRVGHMTYLNSSVFYWSLPRSKFDWLPMPPSKMAQAMQLGKIDVAPLPTAAVFEMENSLKRVRNLCVGVKYLARSVILFSNVPVEELNGKRIGITSQTTTSIQLLRVLMRDFWQNQQVEYVPLGRESEAVLMIGDDALKKLYGNNIYPFYYDLGEAWKNMTGLSFIFALWVIKSSIPSKIFSQFADSLETAATEGLRNLPTIAETAQISGMAPSDVENYLSGFIYFLGEAEERSIENFKARIQTISVY